MNIVVFDDNKWTCDETVSVVKRVIGEKHNSLCCDLVSFSAPLSFEHWLETNTPDVALLDISIPQDENFGIKIAKKIRQQHENCHIVFITSNEEKISMIFSGLIRPTQFIVKNNGVGELEKVIDEIILSLSDKEGVICVSYGRNEYVLNISDIITVQKDGRKTSVSLSDRTINVSDSMNDIAKKLPDDFFRADKGVIVNLKKVKEVDYPQKMIVMNDEEVVYMSRNAASEIKKILRAREMGAGK